jgi:hypothetical protein
MIRSGKCLCLSLAYFQFMVNGNTDMHMMDRFMGIDIAAIFAGEAIGFDIG